MIQFDLMQTGDSHSYWDSLAVAYASLGPPLKPSPEDILIMREAVAQAGPVKHPHSGRAFILGVTPDIAEKVFPHSWAVIGMDRSPGMTRIVWPGRNGGGRHVLCGNWQSLPFGDRSFDAIVGDGSLNCLLYPSGLRAVAASVHRVLRDEGRFVVRCYLPPLVREGPEDVFADLWRGAIPSLNHFKLRMWTALQETPEKGITLAAIYQAWKDQRLDVDQVVARTGWDRVSAQMIELYKGHCTVLSFPTLTEFRAVFREFFDEVSCSIPAYSLGERCQILVLKPRRTGPAM
ncbi:MAG: methyltransferase domain-containing protein [Bryobacteraceae bacterium]